MPNYFLRTTHVISLEPPHQPQPGDVVDWLERALRLEGAEVNRDGERALTFRPTFWPLLAFRNWKSESTLALIARGEIEVDSTPDGPRFTAYLQPRSWLAVIPLVQVALLFGWADATNVLRWGAGLGGFVLAGLVVGWAWVNAQDIFGRIAEEIRISCLNVPPRREGAA
jgi:hypothetical protein